MFKSKLPAFAVIVLLVLEPAYATDGYFSHGFGIKSQAVGGVGIALPQDGLAAAANPAGTAFVADSIDLGLTWFKPKRNAVIVDNGAGLNGQYDGNGKSDFFIPELGYIQHFSDTISAGVAVYGNGGMNTEYETNPFAAFGSSGDAGVNLEQLFIAPSVAFKLNEQNSFGVAVNFAYQRFSADGLQAFVPFSVSGTNLSNLGNDSSTGWGVRLGWTGRLTPDLTIGATWVSKVKTSEFDKYSGLFAEAGSFDIPANYGVGVAYKVTPAVTLAADISRIEYSKIVSVANPLSNLFLGNPLGSANGPGFGWRDITVFKLGFIYDYSADLTLRAGFNHSDQPIPKDQTLLNILAPAVVRDHLTLGATWKLGNGNEISFAYTHAFSETVEGSNSIPAGFAGGEADISLKENILGVAYSWKL